MNTVDVSVVGGLVYVDGELRECTLGVTDGTISHMVDPGRDLDANREIDATGMFVLPGCVDAHVHIRPGDEREGVDSGTSAAAAGGVTTVIDMPNFPPTATEPDRWAELASKYNGKAHVDYGIFGHVSTDNIGTTDIASLAEAGALAFKAFMSVGGGPGPYSIPDSGDLLTAFEAVAGTGRPLWVHSEDDELHVEYIDRSEKKGLTGFDAFFKSAPPILERAAVSEVIELARETDVTTVIAHTTTATALDLIHDANANGVPIYAEVSPYHLGIDQEQVRDIGTKALGTPPVRDTENRMALWDRLNAGKVDTLGTDHAPRTLEEKNRPPIEAGPGMPQLETALPFMLSAANEDRTKVETVVTTYSEMPAKLLGLYPKKGSLHLGTDADFVLVDPDDPWTVDPKQFESRARYSPFEGREFSAKIAQTFLRGQEVARDMQALDVTPGQLVDHPSPEV
ncbi:MAG: dihydroorotase [Halodesulfurarchaeum sp.]|nr:dihydroorotase [Halodesulfurarchaeum sp.]